MVVYVCGKDRMLSDQVDQQTIDDWMQSNRENFASGNQSTIWNSFEPEAGGYDEQRVPPLSPFLRALAAYSRQGKG